MRRVRLAQIMAVIRLEVKKTFFAKRGLWIYLLAFLPLGLFVAHALVLGHQREIRDRIASESRRQLTYQDLTDIHSGMSRDEVIERLGKPPISHVRGLYVPKQKQTQAEPKEGGRDSSRTGMRETYRYSDGLNDLYVFLEDGKVTGTRVGQHESLGEDTMVFASVFQFFYLRLAIFFGCLGIFMNLFRGELLDKSLHFYFLAPIRRDLLMLAKYFAGLLAATAVFVSSAALQFAALAWSLEPTVRNAYLQHGQGLAQGATYLGVTALACVGYGSLFLAAGLWFRNPIIPVGVILIWEALNPFLPAALEKISVIYYLKSLCPVEIQVGPGTPAILAMLISNPEPVSPPVAISGLILVSVATLVVASRRVQRMEINYTTE